jgi:hypothetical protein
MDPEGSPPEQSTSDDVIKAAVLAARSARALGWEDGFGYIWWHNQPLHVSEWDPCNQKSQWITMIDDMLSSHQVRGMLPPEAILLLSVVSYEAPAIEEAFKASGGIFRVVEAWCEWREAISRYRESRNSYVKTMEEMKEWWEKSRGEV